MEAQKLSLGLKPSYFEGEEEEDEPDLAADDMDEEAFAAAAEVDSDEDDMIAGRLKSCLPGQPFWSSAEYADAGLPSNLCMLGMVSSTYWDAFVCAACCSEGIISPRCDNRARPVMLFVCLCARLHVQCFSR